MSTSLTRNILTKGNLSSASGLVTGGRYAGISIHVSGPLAGCRRSIRNVSSINALLNGLHRNLTGFDILSGGLSAGLIRKINHKCNVGLIQTDHGPITRGFGDGRLARPSDVEVRVDGQTRTVKDVSPLLGLILLENGVKAGADVEVDYTWTDSPYVQAEFNQDGLLFNQFDEYSKHGSRFPYFSMFGPNRNPPQVDKHAYKYTAQEEPYSTVLNDFAETKFNEHIHNVAIHSDRHTPSPTTVEFEGRAHPDTGQWTRRGQSLPSSPTIRDELYVLEDTQKSTDRIQGQAAFFEHEEDLTFDYLSLLNTRLRLESASPPSDSVFQGVGWGWTDEDSLYMAGLIDDGDIQTAALYRGGDLDEWDSWAGIEGQVESNTQLSFEFDPDLTLDQKVRVGGSIFQVDSIDEDGDRWKVTLDGSHGASGTAELWPDTPIDELTSYRIFRSDGGDARLFARGGVSPSSSIESPPSREEDELPVASNTVFFGSLDVQSKNETSWDFVRWSQEPTQGSESDDDVVVAEDFSDLPSTDGKRPWLEVGDRGYSAIVEEDYLLVEQAGRVGQEEGIGWARIEPFLDPQSNFYLQTAVRVDAFAGNFPLFINVLDGQRELTLALFGEDMSSPPSGQTLDVQPDPPSLEQKGSTGGVASDSVDHTFQLANTGKETFSDSGWSSSLDSSEITFDNDWMEIDHTNGTRQSATVTTDEPSSAQSQNVFEDWAFSARIRLKEWQTDSNGFLPLWTGVEDGDHQIFLRWREDGQGNRTVAFADPFGRIFEEMSFDWKKEVFYTYKIVRSEDTISLFVDGDYKGFVSTSNIKQKTRDPFEVFFEVDDGDVHLDLDYIFAHSTEYGTRHVALYEGGDRFDSSNYRTVQKDWLGEFLPIRIKKDLNREIEVFLDHEDSPSFDLSWRDLPRQSDDFGLNTDYGIVRFGSFESSGFAEVVWKTLLYRIQHVRGDQRSLHSGFNETEQATSLDPLSDSTVQEVTVQSDDRRTVDISGLQRNFNDVFQVRENNNTYLFDWDERAGKLHLKSDLPADHTSVTVVYDPGQPYTDEYLASLRSVEHLFGETPLFAETEEVQYQKETNWLVAFNDPDTLMNNEDTHFNDFSFETVFDINEEGYYQNLEIDESTNGGRKDLLSPACDVQGLSGLELRTYKDTYSLPDQKDWQFNEDPILLDDTRFKMDQLRDVLDPLSPTRAQIQDLRKDTYNSPTDQALDDKPHSFIQDYDGALILDSPGVKMDHTSSQDGYGQMDVYSSSDTDLTFDTTFNWP